MNISLYRVERGAVKNSRGTMLVMVLWLILIMSIFGLGLSRISYANYRFAKFRIDNLLSLHAANAVLAICKYAQMEDATPGYDACSELPKEEEYTFGNVRVVYSVEDEEARIDINMAPSTVLKDLPEMDMDLAVDIRSSEYRPFRTRESLFLVDDMDEEVYEAIKDLITVHGRSTVNINTCPGEILETLGMSDRLVSIILRYRSGEDGDLGTQDDLVFETKSGISETLKEEHFLTTQSEMEIVTVMSKGILAVSSENFRLNADVYVSNRLVDRFSIVFGLDSNKKEGRYYIKEWNQR